MTSKTTSSAPSRTPWAAVSCLSVLTFVLVASEFLPVSLLNPIAAEYGITEGLAGLSISISGVFAVVTSLFGNSLLSRFNRRSVVLAYTAILVVAGAMTAIAPNYPIFLIGRALIGVTVGGFWSISTSVLARLATPNDLPRAIAFLQVGTALATVLAAPLGSFLGGLFGWRVAFFAVVPVGLIGLMWQFAVLPRIAPERSVKILDVAKIFRNRVFAIGMFATALVFMGQFALATYIRPYLQDAAGLHVNALSLVLLGLGVGGFIGTIISGPFVRDHLFATMFGLPVVLASIAALLIFMVDFPISIGILFFVWGIFTTPIPIAWGTWMTRVIPNALEAGGAAQVAFIQLAIGGGAYSGGLLLDQYGWESTFWLSVGLFVLAAITAVLARERP